MTATSILDLRASRRRAPGRRSLPLLALTCVAALLGPVGAARAADPGPALSGAPAAVAQSLQCPSTFTAPRGPLLLVHGTTSDSTVWQQGTQAYLTREGFDVCLIDLPGNAANDIQVSGEFLVQAIRDISEQAGKPVAVVGHSQGGMVPRWAIKFWPDMRRRISMLIGIEPSNHGAAAGAAALCATTCPGAIRQQIPGSTFLATLNKDFETVPSINYTTIGSESDTTVPLPSPALAAAPNVANLTIQQICPDRQVDHVPAVFDAAANAILIDALTHSGLASLQRISRSICAQQYLPGGNQATIQTYENGTFPFSVRVFTTSPQTLTEPALKDYARQAAPDPTDTGQPATPPAQTTVTPASTTTAAAPVGTTIPISPPAGVNPQPTSSPTSATVAPTACASRRRFTITLQGGLRRASVSVAGKRVAVRARKGRLTATVDLRGQRKQTVQVRVRATTRTGRVLRSTRSYRTCTPNR